MVATMRFGGLPAGVALAVTALLTACAATTNGTPAAVPSEFQSACGHPGAKVHVRKVPVTVSHDRCDLTGVQITYRNYGGAYVSKKPGVIATSSGFTLTVQPGSLDVTVDAPSGPPGNA